MAPALLSSLSMCECNARSKQPYHPSALSSISINPLKPLHNLGEDWAMTRSTLHVFVFIG
jgi:hypothetical protein